MIPVNVEKISYHPSSRSYAVLLKDEKSKLVLPILVGSFEAQSIALAIEVVATPRPLTHDLICDIINKIDADLIAVNISQLNDGVFYAKLKIKGPKFGTKMIDARPSDAISIALRLNAQIFVNPEVIERSENNNTYEEGCLSVPGQFAEIDRPDKCHIKYLDYYGEQKEIKAEGMLATCIQHEMDHLEGILFIDYLSKLKKSMIIKKLSKQKKTIERIVV